ncbi:hypothetical protein, partial [Acinetobacter baumannii]|uniref:hypothetical protein n=1 Tax=Acinetobacter baumannii TaxID=470 RepID=UPI001EF0E63F
LWITLRGGSMEKLSTGFATRSGTLVPSVSGAEMCLETNSYGGYPLKTALPSPPSFCFIP